MRRVTKKPPKMLIPAKTLKPSQYNHKVIGRANLQRRTKNDDGGDGIRDCHQRRMQ